jgi:hypothetical protein
MNFTPENRKFIPSLNSAPSSLKIEGGANSPLFYFPDSSQTDNKYRPILTFHIWNFFSKLQKTQNNYCFLYKEYPSGGGV